MNRLGIDIGGTKIEAIVLDSNNNILIRTRVPTERDNGYEHILNQLSKLHYKIKKYLVNKFHFGVSVPGPLNENGDKLKKSNTVVMINKPIKKNLYEIFKSEPILENDANCFAQAETSLGAAKNKKIVFGVILGTGVGGGITINGKVCSGLNNIAGEWGHTILFTNGKKCHCGNSGCVEQYLSGPSLEEYYFNLTNKKAIVTDIAKNPPKQWKDNFLNNFGMALANVINIIDPEVIVVGGGVSKVNFLYSEGPEWIEKFTFSKNIKTPILKNKMGDSAGVFGAAFLQ
tara:strand:+ start:457 stop:1317 length:861 start_codon:yes stop_codon:yes gene_type:complete